MSRTRKITLGTKEWADSNVNCYLGCANDCKYCYAKKIAIRFHKKTDENWKEMIPNYKNIEKGYRKRKGRVMFPTSHDITKESLANCLTVLKKLTTAGNSVLITTKPRLDCVKKICRNFILYRDLIQFRFTITSIDNDLLKFWEPDAPLLEERMESLNYAFDNGYKTSVSIEPFLDEDPFNLVEILKPYTTESIWIGKINYISPKNYQGTERDYFFRIKNINSIENLSKIIERAKEYNDSFLRIKDSISNFLAGKN